MYLIMSENARILNTNLILLRVVSLRSRFLLFEKVQKRVCIVFVKRSTADAWQGDEYASDTQYTRVDNMALLLNMPAFCIYHGSEYARILNILRL